MELRLERLSPKETYTIGRLYINNEFFCNTLEDKIVDKNKNGIQDEENTGISDIRERKRFMESQQFRMVPII